MKRQVTKKPTKLNSIKNNRISSKKLSTNSKLLKIKTNKSSKNQIEENNHTKDLNNNSNNNNISREIQFKELESDSENSRENSLRRTLKRNLTCNMNVEKEKINFNYNNNTTNNIINKSKHNTTGFPLLSKTISNYISVKHTLRTELSSNKLETGNSDYIMNTNDLKERKLQEILNQLKSIDCIQNEHGYKPVKYDFVYCLTCDPEEKEPICRVCMHYCHKGHRQSFKIQLVTNCSCGYKNHKINNNNNNEVNNSLNECKFNDWSENKGKKLMVKCNETNNKLCFFCFIFCTVCKPKKTNLTLKNRISNINNISNKSIADSTSNNIRDIKSKRNKNTNNLSYTNLDSIIDDNEMTSFNECERTNMNKKSIKDNILYKSQTYIQNKYTIIESDINNNTNTNDLNYNNFTCDCNDNTHKDIKKVLNALKEINFNKIKDLNSLLSECFTYQQFINNIFNSECSFNFTFDLYLNTKHHVISSLKNHDYNIFDSNTISIMSKTLKCFDFAYINKSISLLLLSNNSFSLNSDDCNVSSYDNNYNTNIMNNHNHHLSDYLPTNPILTTKSKISRTSNNKFNNNSKNYLLEYDDNTTNKKVINYYYSVNIDSLFVDEDLFFNFLQNPNLMNNSSLLFIGEQISSIFLHSVFQRNFPNSLPLLNINELFNFNPLYRRMIIHNYKKLIVEMHSNGINNENNTNNNYKHSSNDTINNMQNLNINDSELEYIANFAENLINIIKNILAKFNEINLIKCSLLKNLIVMSYYLFAYDIIDYETKLQFQLIYQEIILLLINKLQPISDKETYLRIEDDIIINKQVLEILKFILFSMLYSAVYFNDFVFLNLINNETSESMSAFIEKMNNYDDDNLVFNNEKKKSYEFFHYTFHDNSLIKIINKSNIEIVVFFNDFKYKTLKLYKDNIHLSCKLQSLTLNNYEAYLNSLRYLMFNDNYTSTWYDGKNVLSNALSNREDKDKDRDKQSNISSSNIESNRDNNVNKNIEENLENFYIKKMSIDMISNINHENENDKGIISDNYSFKMMSYIILISSSLSTDVLSTDSNLFFSLLIKNNIISHKKLFNEKNLVNSELIRLFNNNILKKNKFLVFLNLQRNIIENRYYDFYNNIINFSTLQKEVKHNIIKVFSYIVRILLKIEEANSNENSNSNSNNDVNRNKNVRNNSKKQNLKYTIINSLNKISEFDLFKSFSKERYFKTKSETNIYNDNPTITNKTTNNEHSHFNCLSSKVRTLFLSEINVSNKNNVGIEELQDLTDNSFSIFIYQKLNILFLNEPDWIALDKHLFKNIVNLLEKNIYLLNLVSEITINDIQLLLNSSFYIDTIVKYFSIENEYILTKKSHISNDFYSSMTTKNTLDLVNNLRPNYKKNSNASKNLNVLYLEKLRSNNTIVENNNDLIENNTPLNLSYDNNKNSNCNNNNRNFNSISENSNDVHSNAEVEYKDRHFSSNKSIQNDADDNLKGNNIKAQPDINNNNNSNNNNNNLIENDLNTAQLILDLLTLFSIDNIENTTYLFKNSILSGLSLSVYSEIPSFIALKLKFVQETNISLACSKYILQYITKVILSTEIETSISLISYLSKLNTLDENEKQKGIVSLLKIINYKYFDENYISEVFNIEKLGVSRLHSDFINSNQSISKGLGINNNNATRSSLNGKINRNSGLNDNQLNLVNLNSNFTSNTEHSENKSLYYNTFSNNRVLNEDEIDNQSVRENDVSNMNNDYNINLNSRNNMIINANETSRFRNDVSLLASSHNNNNNNNSNSNILVERVDSKSNKVYLSNPRNSLNSLYSLNNTNTMYDQSQVIKSNSLSKFNNNNLTFNVDFNSFRDEIKNKNNSTFKTNTYKKNKNKDLKNDINIDTHIEETNLLSKSKDMNQINNNKLQFNNSNSNNSHYINNYNSNSFKKQPSKNSRNQFMDIIRASNRRYLFIYYIRIINNAFDRNAMHDETSFLKRVLTINQIKSILKNPNWKSVFRTDILNFFRIAYLKPKIDIAKIKEYRSLLINKSNHLNLDNNFKNYILKINSSYLENNEDHNMHYLSNNNSNYHNINNYVLLGDERSKSASNLKQKPVNRLRDIYEDEAEDSNRDEELNDVQVYDKKITSEFRFKRFRALNKEVANNKKKELCNTLKAENPIKLPLLRSNYTKESSTSNFSKNNTQNFRNLKNKKISDLVFNVKNTDFNSSLDKRSKITFNSNIQTLSSNKNLKDYKIPKIDKVDFNNIQLLANLPNKDYSLILNRDLLMITNSLNRIKLEVTIIKQEIKTFEKIVINDNIDFMSIFSNEEDLIIYFNKGIITPLVNIMKKFISIMPILTGNDFVELFEVTYCFLNLKKLLISLSLHYSNDVSYNDYMSKYINIFESNKNNNNNNDFKDYNKDPDNALSKPNLNVKKISFIEKLKKSKLLENKFKVEFKDNNNNIRSSKATLLVLTKKFNLKDLIIVEKDLSMMSLSTFEILNYSLVYEILEKHIFTILKPQEQNSMKELFEKKKNVYENIEELNKAHSLTINTNLTKSITNNNFNETSSAKSKLVTNVATLINQSIVYIKNIKNRQSKLKVEYKIQRELEKEFDMRILNSIVLYENMKCRLASSSIIRSLAEKNTQFEINYKNLLLKNFFFLIKEESSYVSFTNQKEIYWHLLKMLQYDTTDCQNEIERLYIDHKIDKSIEKLIDIFTLNLTSAIFIFNSNFGSSNNENCFIAITIIKIIKYLCEEHNNFFQTVCMDGIRLDYSRNFLAIQNTIFYLNVDKYNDFSVNLKFARKNEHNKDSLFNNLNSNYPNYSNGNGQKGYDVNYFLMENPNLSNNSNVTIFEFLLFCIEKIVLLSQWGVVKKTFLVRSISNNNNNINENGIISNLKKIQTIIENKKNKAKNNKNTEIRKNENQESFEVIDHPSSHRNEENNENLSNNESNHNISELNTNKKNNHNDISNVDYIGKINEEIEKIVNTNSINQTPSVKKTHVKNISEFSAKSGDCILPKFKGNDNDKIKITNYNNNSRNIEMEEFKNNENTDKHYSDDMSKEKGAIFTLANANEPQNNYFNDNMNKSSISNNINNSSKIIINDNNGDSNLYNNKENKDKSKSENINNNDKPNKNEIENNTENNQEKEEENETNLYFYDLFFVLVECCIEIIQGTTPFNMEKIVSEAGSESLSNFLRNIRPIVLNESFSKNETEIKIKIDLMNFVLAFLEEKATPQKAILIISYYFPPKQILYCLLNSTKSLYLKIIKELTDSKKSKKISNTELFDYEARELFYKKYFTEELESTELEFCIKLFTYIKLMGEEYNNIEAKNILSIDGDVEEKQLIKTFNNEYGTLSKLISNKNKKIKDDNVFNKSHNNFNLGKSTNADVIQILHKDKGRVKAKRCETLNLNELKNLEKDNISINSSQSKTKKEVKSTNKGIKNDNNSNENPDKNINEKENNNLNYSKQTKEFQRFSISIDMYESYFILTFYKRIIRTLFVQRDENIHRVVFTINPKTEYISKNSKKEFLERLDRSKRYTKLFDLVESLDFFYEEAEFKYKSSKNTQFIQGINIYKYTEIIVFIFTLSINIIMLVTLNVKPGYTQYYDLNSIEENITSNANNYNSTYVSELLDNAVHNITKQKIIGDFNFGDSNSIETVIIVLCIISLLVNGISLIFWLMLKLPLYIRQEKSKYIKKNKIKTINSEETVLPFMIWLRNILYPAMTEKSDAYPYVWNIVLTSLAVTRKNNFWIFGLQILILVRLSVTLQTIVRSMQVKLKLVLSILLFLFLLTVVFAFISYYQLRQDFNIKITIDNYTFKENYCSSLIHCLMTLLDFGIRTDGGIHEHITIPEFDVEPGRFIARVIYDILFFVILILILLSILFGIIIDTFAELREHTEKEIYDKKNVCIICGVTRDQLEKDDISFELHISEDHNIWRYINYMIGLKYVDIQETNSINSYVMESIEKKSIAWFPVYR